MTLLNGMIMVVLTLILSQRDCLADKDFVNPSDLLNFDPVNVQMTNGIQESVEKEKDLNHQQQIIENDYSIKGPPSIKEDCNENCLKDEFNVNIKKYCPKVKDDVLKSFFKRYLMSLVQHIENMIDSSDVPVEFCMKMKASYSDMILLKLFGSGDTDNVHQVHEKLESMILYPIQLPSESPIYWLERKIGLSTPILLMVIACLLLVIIGAKMLSSVRITRSFITKGFMLAFIMSCAATCIELYQQKVADQHKVLSVDIAERCPHLSQSTFSYLTGYLKSTFTFQDEHCREYYEALVVNPLFKVSLFEAGAIAITKTIVAPMKILGNGIKGFMIGLLKDVPFQFAWALFVVMLIFLIILPFLIFGYTVKIPFVLTLLPPPSAQQCLPPQETKTPYCINCSHDKGGFKEVEEIKSSKLTAYTGSTIPSISPAHDEEKKTIIKVPTTDCTTALVDADSGNCKQTVGEYSNPLVKSEFQEITIRLKKVDQSPILNESDHIRKVEGRMDDESEIKGDKEFICRSHDEELVPTSAVVLNESCVLDKNALSNSDFFLDQEVRPSDDLNENGSTFPSENIAADGVENLQVCSNHMSCKMRLDEIKMLDNSR